MKLKYPAEAFALGIVLFSAGMKEAFAAGILVILAAVFAEFLKNLLEDLVPDWSLKACVLVGTAAVSSSTFTLGFATLGILMETRIWLLTFIIGVLAAKYVLTADLQADYNEMFWEAGIAWGFWVLLATTREFMGAGSIFGNYIAKMPFQSKTFLEIYFGFLTAGLVLAFTNGVLKKRTTDTHSFLWVAPLVAFMRPFDMMSFGEITGLIWTIIVPLVLFYSVKKILRFSRAGMAYRGLPNEMMAMGFIYMILSIY